MFSLAKRLFASSLAADHYFSSAGNTSEGLRILNVDDESIGYQMGLESWFDYILSLNGFEVTQLAGKDFSKFVDMVAANIDNGRDLVFTVWSAKGGTIRQISVPSTRFSSAESDETDSLEEIKLDDSSNVERFSKYKKMGISVQLSSLETATYVWHVLHTLPNSPGHSANLLPGSDYIIGAQDGLLAMGGEDLLGQVLYSVYCKNPGNATLVLYVYNQIHNVVRPVTIYPNRNWGGIGLLGCDVGYGFLHRIPEVGPEAKDQIVATTEPIKQSFIVNSNNSAEKELSQPVKKELNSSHDKAVSSQSSATITDSQHRQFSGDLTDTSKKQINKDESSKHEDIPMPPSITNVSTKTQLNCPIANASNPLIATPYHARKKRHRHKVELTEYIDEQKESPKEAYNTNVHIPASPPILNRG
ncbi:BA75_04437T0 [Komagataella pastoris]|uniref:BA75_04437T0 n=1 Tax=Komagataella pastoris TaxID=4922 RepID=A0A1B2JIK7_PICPA|nr:BA75_04437T0 [Komagataella pastoris]